MRTRVGLRGGVRALAAIGLVAGGWLIAAPAQAQSATSIDDVGWWARVNQEPTLGGLLAGPDVTPGQLLVEGTPEGATAIAALRATLPEGTGNPVLTLRTSSAVGAEAAVLLACQSGSGWTGAHAGAWEAKPSPDCTQSVQGLLSEDGASISFALAPLQFGDQLDVVLTPGVVADADGAPSSAFRIVFDRPDVASFEVVEGAGSASPPPAAPSAPFVVASPSPPIGTGSSGSSFTPPAATSGSEVAMPPVRAALPETEQGATATAPIAQAQTPLAAPALAATGGSDGRLLGVVVVLAAGALLYWSSQQPVPQHQVLSRFASAAPHPVEVAPAADSVGGLGRFRRERTGAARRLAG